MSVPIPVARAVPPAVFEASWYRPRQPVVLEDLDIGRAGAWTPERLTELLGTTPVEVMTGWSAGPEENVYLALESHRQTVPFAEYAALVSSGARPDVYMVANNPLLALPSAAPLWGDLRPDPRYLVRDPRRSFLWFGPAGTVTHFHHDVVSVLFRQVMGRKRWTLIPPHETAKMYATVGVYSAVDVTRPDYARHPRFAGVARADFDLGPGQALLVPAGWWHAVVALDPSISVSFTSFRWPNP